MQFMHVAYVNSWFLVLQSKYSIDFTRLHNRRLLLIFDCDFNLYKTIGDHPCFEVFGSIGLCMIAALRRLDAMQAYERNTLRPCHKFLLEFQGIVMYCTPHYRVWFAGELGRVRPTLL